MQSQSGSILTVEVFFPDISYGTRKATKWEKETAPLSTWRHIRQGVYKW